MEKVARLSPSSFGIMLAVPYSLKWVRRKEFLPVCWVPLWIYVFLEQCIRIYSGIDLSILAHLELEFKIQDKCVV
jgi:hypothetical protein